MPIGATWRIRLNRPCAAAMRPFVKLLGPLVLLLTSFTFLCLFVCKKLKKLVDYVSRMNCGRYNKNSSGDEIANVNFLRQHRTCRAQRLRPFNEFVISTKRLRQKRYTLPTCLEMDSPVQSASHNKSTRPSVKETHQATWA